MDAAVEQWVHKEVEEVAEEVGLNLHGRRRRQTTTSSTTIAGTTTTSIHGAESSSSQKQLTDAPEESGVILDEDNTGTAASIEELLHSKDANFEVTTSDHTNVLVVSNLPVPPSVEKVEIFANIASSSISNKLAAETTTEINESGTSSSLITESRSYDETDLYLDKVYDNKKKQAVAHEFYCPNCKSCIQKVIVREFETESAPLLGTFDDDRFRCTSCFSFLIPAGNWFFRGWRSDQDSVAEPKLAEDRDYSSVGEVPDRIETQPVPPTETAVPPGDEISPAEQINVAPISLAAAAAAVVGVGLTLEAVKTQDDTIGKDINVPYSKLDPSIQQVEFDRGVISSDAMGVLITDYKQSQKKEPDDEQTVKATESIKLEDSELPPSTSFLIPGLEDEEPIIPSEVRDDKKLEIIKSIVYGGLTESITSLGVVTSAASAGASTLNIVALSLANIVGGFFVIGHNLRELKSEQSEGTSDQTNEQADRYKELLGNGQNFILHATVAILSFLVFGLVPPLVYGFSFRKSDDKDYKLAAVAAASLLCIILLAALKAYVKKPPKKYIRTLLYYVVIGFMTSGVSYLAGELIKKLIEKLRLFDSVAVHLAEMNSGRPAAAWTSY